MPTLGANLDDLLDLERRLSDSLGQITDQRTNAASLVRSVIAVFSEQACRTHEQLSLAAERIMTDVDRAKYLADLADWRGGNQVEFDDAYSLFWRTMRSTTNTMDFYFAGVEEQVAELTADLQEYQQSLEGNLNAAADSTLRMRGMVATQRIRLDNAMNRTYRQLVTGVGAGD